MDNVDVPVTELEHHGVPLHGFWVLEEREVPPLDSFSSVSNPETQEAAQCVAEHTEPHGDFVEIWKMSQAVEVKHPSPWYIQYPIFVSNNNQSIWSIFNGLFGTGLREVDSAMAATLTNLLGPSSVTLCHVVPLPSHHEDLTPQVDAMTNLPEWNNLDSDLSVEDDEELRLNDMEIAAKAHIAAQIEKAQNEDPLWAQVTADLGLALAGNADVHECILPMVLAAQSKRRCTHVRRIDLKLLAIAYPVVSMVHNDILRVITTMLCITPPIVRHLLVALPIGLVLIPPCIACLLPASILLIASVPLLTVPLLTIPLLANPLLAIPLANPLLTVPLADPLLTVPLTDPLLADPSPIPPHHSPPHPPPNQQYGPEMEINHQEQETPVCPVVSPPDPGDSKMQDVQQAVPPPQDHMPVDPPFQAALPITPPLSPCDEQGGTNEVGLEPSGEMVEDLNPLVVVGDWYCIEFFGVTANVDIKAIFQLLMHDGLLRVRVHKNKTAKGPARKKQKVLLAFKSQQRQDLILKRFVSGHYSLWEFEQAVSVPVSQHEAIFSFQYVLDPDYVEMSFSYQTSLSDLATLLEHAPPH
ncbi:hypothetical protein BS47DRAFT_1389591 [Hydnum rufescens UP504]|uniref:Uncharacterized protein n=1 Tax=Hydnum rufescens UP504 TaxID=1448309 RepID=A0A9P6B5I9_9AGAM|nr:hypothetical protein BS47DRAFT_1389591 [Hydnum rufescens UP504]